MGSVFGEIQIEAFDGFRFRNARARLRQVVRDGDGDEPRHFRNSSGRPVHNLPRRSVEDFHRVGRRVRHDLLGMNESQ